MKLYIFPVNGQPVEKSHVFQLEAISEMSWFSVITSHKLNYIAFQATMEICSRCSSKKFQCGADCPIPLNLFEASILAMVREN